MFDLANATLTFFSLHVGTPFRLGHPEHAETFTLVQADPIRSSSALGLGRDPFALVFDGSRTDVQFDQQILPLEHADIGRLQLFLVPIGRNADGTIRYQALFS